MLTPLRFIMALAALALAAPALAAEPAWLGDWALTVRFGADSQTARLTLEAKDGAVSGSSGPLDENAYFPLAVAGKPNGAGADLTLTRPNGEVVGRLELRPDKAGLTGSGALYGVAVQVIAERPWRPSRPARTLDMPEPPHHLYYAARNPPAARIAPGDRVRTTTLDNEGQDAALQWRAMPGNTLSGPFYVEGAMPGDTLVVHIERVALSRDSAKMSSGALNQKAVQGGHVQTPTPGWDRTWTLDRARGVARLASPSDRLKGLELPLRPMIGSIGVAPPRNQALDAGDLGFHGGNLDFKRITTGATLYLPVWRAGALLSLGDGHALQGDGEISGQGLETSLEVEFRVELIKGWNLGQVWSEDADQVMVSGIDNSLEASLQMATSGMARWLKREHGLTDSEIAALLSAAIEYEIAEVVDARPHVVAKLAKKTLAMLPKPQPGQIKTGGAVSCAACR